MMKDREVQKLKARAYQRAMLLLRKKYPKEFKSFFETKASGPTYSNRYQQSLRNLRFRHPRVFARAYQSFLEIDGLS